MSEPLTHKAVARESVVDAVAESLRSEILSGTYAPGQYLPPARELAEQYSVTRTSLKHALMRLTQAGLLETKHGVGTRVTDFEQQGGIELLPMLMSSNAAGWTQALFEVRTDIGTAIAVRAAQHASQQQRDELATIAEKIREAPDADAAQVTESEWHRVLARATGNRVYPMLMNLVLDTYLRQREALYGPFRDPATTADQLAPLVHAVCSGAETEVVRASARAYLDWTGKQMMESMTSSGGAG